MCVCTCACTHMSVCAYRFYINLHAHKHLYMRAYTTKWAYLGVHAEVCACTRARVCMRVGVGVCA